MAGLGAILADQDAASADQNVILANQGPILVDQDAILASQNAILADHRQPFWPASGRVDKGLQFSVYNIYI